MIFRHLLNMQSHPTWVRGLKLLVHRYNRKPHYVAPYVGAWIETISFIWLFEDNMSHPTWVRGLKLQDSCRTISPLSSHPTWVRGLKLLKVM